MFLIQATGIGKVINGFRKKDGAVGMYAKALVIKWKMMVTEEAMRLEAEYEKETACQSDQSERESGSPQSDRSESRLPSPESDQSDRRSSSPEGGQSEESPSPECSGLSRSPTPTNDASDDSLMEKENRHDRNHVTGGKDKNQKNKYEESRTVKNS